MSQELVKAIRQDPNYRKFMRIVENVRGKVDLEANRKEALGLHASRVSRSLYGSKKYSPTALLDAAMQDLSFRSRMVELRVKLDAHIATLEEAVEAMRRHISTEYSEELRDFSTADQRKSFVNRVIKESNKFLVEGQALIGSLDFLIKDLDQSGHSMRHAVDCLKVLAANSGKNIG